MIKQNLIMDHVALLLCVVLWGVSTFLNRISVEQLPPFMMQVIVGLVFVLYMPLAFKLQGTTPFEFKWTLQSVLLTTIATVISIVANILLYMSLKGSNHTGASTMMVSMYPIVTLILSASFLNEQFTATKIAGICAMVFGAILLCLK